MKHQDNQTAWAGAVMPLLELIHLSMAALLLAAAPAALAQTPYPSQQIKIICPFPAGGGTDLTSRLLGEQESKDEGGMMKDDPTLRVQV